MLTAHPTNLVQLLSWDKYFPYALVTKDMLGYQKILKARMKTMAALDKAQVSSFFCPCKSQSPVQKVWGVSSLSWEFNRSTSQGSPFFQFSIPQATSSSCFSSTCNVFTSIKLNSNGIALSQARAFQFILFSYHLLIFKSEDLHKFGCSWSRNSKGLQT